jgi:murein DD-endopeptidase MepM/ murein hydrolase activator NlpD
LDFASVVVVLAMGGAKYIPPSPTGKGLRLAKPRRKGRLRVVCAVVFAFATIVSWQKEISRFILPQHPQRSACKEPSIAAPRPSVSAKFSIKRHIVQAGDTLYDIFHDLHLSVACLAECSDSCPEFAKLNDLQPEDELAVHVSRLDQEPTKLVYSSVDGATYTFYKTDEEWKCKEENPPPVVSYQSANGIITDSLYESCLRSEVPPSLVMDLADLFEYDIDFNSDIQEGDTFAIYYGEQVKNGRKIHSGPILAAEMAVGGQRHRAFFFELPDGYAGYFNEKGESLRKLFLKAPLRFSRISSTFTYKRFHPILRIFRPHLGIDYAAPKGTPVSALGSGTITFIGRRGGFGRYIEISHNATYKTGYGHLSAFNKHLHRGSKVVQGDVIGYVGSSGLATGPHLDFRFYKNGRPMNFLKTTFPYARSIPKGRHADFARKVQVYLAAMHGKGHVAEFAGSGAAPGP